MLNPVRLQWNAPTQNTDGTPIQGELNYRLLVNGSDFLDFPGSLNQDGTYGEDTADMNLPSGALTLRLKAFYTANPSVISDPSNALEVLIVRGNPEAPENFFAV